MKIDPIKRKKPCAHAYDMAIRVSDKLYLCPTCGEDITAAVKRIFKKNSAKR